MSRSAFAEQHPWTSPWWKADGENSSVMAYIVAVHILAIVGFVLFPLPGWKIFLGWFIMACAGGLGTTVGYHRALAHRAVKLNPVVEQILIFFACFNGSGTPSTWIANHRNHHANTDSALPLEIANRYDAYKDWLRTMEIRARQGLMRG